MRTVIIPHRDPNKAGATEHVDAIIQSLKNGVISESVTIADPVETRYDQQGLGLREQLEALKAKYGEAKYIVVTGDYGADKVTEDANVAEIFRNVLGEADTQVLLSSYTVESKTIQAALVNGKIDYLAVPRHAVESEVLDGTPAERVILDNQEKLISMTAVPHKLNAKSLEKKHEEWDQAAKEGKVKPLPEPDTARNMIAIMIPGDVEDAGGKPKLFTENNARTLAAAIAGQITPDTLVMVSNGPRTGKYNEAAFETALKEGKEPNPNNPEFQNPQRMDSIEQNPVALAFIDELKKHKHISEANIVLGCIEKGKVPPQGFLAFYDVLNKQAARGGQATLFIDGVSTTMMAQAANVLDPRVGIIACDTPAKNKTHSAGIQDLLAHGHVNAELSLQDGRYVFAPNVEERAKKKFDDAAVVAEKIVELARQNQTFVERTGRRQTGTGRGQV